MATVRLIELLASGLVTSAGTPIASGKVRAYQLGTFTPEVVYSDNAGAVAYSQPITLTAGGTATVYMSAPIRLVIKDATDTTTLLDVNMVGGGPASDFVTSSSFNGGAETRMQTILDAVDDSFGGTDWKYKTGTSSRFVKDAIGEIALTPQDYGAIGNGVADDTAAFAALATAQLNTGRPVFIPKGIYQLSAVTTFTGVGAVVRGSGRGDPLSAVAPATVLRGTNGTMNCLAFTGSGAVVENLQIYHTATSTGTGLAATGGTAFVRNVMFPGAYATAMSISGSGLGGHATDCIIQGTTNATVGSWQLDSCTTSGAVSATTRYVPATSSASGLLFATNTTDMANGGNTTPTVGVGFGQVVAHHRIRGTSAGGGTVNATSTPSDTKVLILDCFNNSGGAYTFTLNAQYHGTGNPAPANGTRRVVAYVWDPSQSAWFEFARSAADVT